MSTLLLFLALSCLHLTTGQSPIQIGAFTSLAHGLGSGAVTLLDTRRVLIQGFKYDGAGPDAYFVVGKGEQTVNLLIGENDSKLQISHECLLTVVDTMWGQL